MTRELELLDSLLKTAISEKKIIEFNYHGYRRIVEPHVYGIKDGKYQIQVYQIAGGSESGGIPEWRRMDLDEVSGMRLSEERFKGPRPYPSGKHSEFDDIIAVVE